MTNQEILELLKHALAEVEPRHEQLARSLELESSLVDLGLDSLSITAAAGHIEQELDILLPDEEIASVFDVQSFVETVRRQICASTGELAP